MKLVKNVPRFSIQELYEKIDSYDIYNHYIPGLKLNERFNNPFRKDKNPSLTVFVTADKSLMHHDFADENWRGGPFNLVAKIFNITVSEAIQVVAADFGFVKRELELQKIALDKPILTPKEHSFIQIKTRKWNKDYKGKAWTKDSDFWTKKYDISKEQLDKENVFCVQEFYLNRRSQMIKPTELCYAYGYNNNTVFKVYYPDRKKGTKLEEFKWFSNIPTSTVENEEVIEKYEHIVITKSKKCRMVLSNIFKDIGIINVQNESSAAFTQELQNKLQGKKVWLNFDSDPPGKKNSLKITGQFGFKHINVPDKYLPEIKDYSDLYEAYGEKPIIRQFKSKGII